MCAITFAKGKESLASQHCNSRRRQRSDCSRHTSAVSDAMEVWSVAVLLPNSRTAGFLANDYRPLQGLA